ncbi:MAG TPA: hypothetical protein VF771_12345, partial [Longimicrobiaceae bacterium]
NVCDHCLGGGFNIPEVDLVDLVDWPGVAKLDLPLRLVFPRPCPRWTSLGPVNVTGRIGVLAIHPTDGNTLYAGATGGGVWKTSTGGTNWSARMSEELSLAIGGLGIAASDPDVLYAATGEWTAGIGAPVDPVTTGVGVYRSANAGVDWDLCAPIPSNTCSSVAVDPTNANRVFVGGNLALHRSTNGGASWDVPVGKVHGVFDGEISDVVMAHDDPNRLYIGVHRAGVYRTTDGGATWTPLATGIDTGMVADSPKISLGRAGVHGSSFVAVKMGERVYTSIDGGTTFTRQADVGGPIWYFAWTNVIAVDPTNESVLLAGAVSLYRSTDGGATWSYSGAGVHSDNQGIVFDPANHNHVYVATDGGIWRSTDNGVTWAFTSGGLVATHFYNMSVSQTPTLRYGGAIQDDSGYAYTGVAEWTSLGLGEGGYLEYDPNNENVLYHDTWFSGLLKSTNGGATWSNLGFNTDLWYGEPLAIARTSSNRLLAIMSGTTLRRSTDGGATWANVLAPAGVSFTAVRFAPSDDNHAYAGSNDGRVWHSADGGA